MDRTGGRTTQSAAVSVSVAMALTVSTGCGGGAARVAPRPEPSPTAPAAPGLSDPPAGMTLRLFLPGTSRAEILGRVPGCGADLGPQGERCEVHGWVRPLSSPCDDGCTWWTYQFDGDRLDVTELKRSVWDVDATHADTFAAEAERIAEELTRRLGAAPQVDHLGRWDAVEPSPAGTTVLLERWTWMRDELLVSAVLSGEAGHHDGVVLTVRVEGHPDDLRVDMLDPGLQTGAPLLRLRGGPLARPVEVPLWLTFDEQDRAYDNCSVGHEALAFPLPDGRIYVGQYNTLCGGPRQCRVLDPRTGAADPPAGACLWGEGIHHRASAIGDGYVLLVSDAEGGGAVQVVRYDPTRGAEVRLQLSTSATAPLRAEVRDGGVDFDTVCDLPPGCEHRDYGEVASRAYRWTAERGLAPR